jgi:hypothetical protein
MVTLSSLARLFAQLIARGTGRGTCRDSLLSPTAMGGPNSSSVRSLASATLVVLFAMISTLHAPETNICKVSANP